ncbi:hypothetical protein [uncultured Alloprevotella sp.]|uniref:hypothetical protein n=1 Tax=uncultured Alloprevotella sp. TaxID=1283315 RepID=UPI00325F96E9
MSYIDQFKEECKPLVFALEHGDEILDIVTWEVYWHGENEDGSDLTLDLNTVEECLYWYIDYAGGRENIAECLGLNERKSKLILQYIEADDYSNFRDLRDEEYYETPEKHDAIRTAVSMFRNIGQWIFNPERQTAYGVNEEFCNSIYSQLVGCLEDYDFDTYPYNEAVLTMADLEAYAKEKGPFYIANVTKLMSEAEDFNFDRDFDNMIKEKVVQEYGLDPDIPLYPVVAGFLLPTEEYFCSCFERWKGLAGRVLEDGIFDKENVLKFD